MGKIPWRKEWLPTPVFLPGEFHAQRSLTGYSPRSCKKLDISERLILIVQVLSLGHSLSALRDWLFRRGKGGASIYRSFSKQHPHPQPHQVITTPKKLLLIKPRSLKLLNLVFSYVWKDASLGLLKSFLWYVPYLATASILLLNPQFPQGEPCWGWPLGLLASRPFVYWYGRWHSLSTFDMQIIIFPIYKQNCILFHHQWLAIILANNTLFTT